MEEKKDLKNSDLEKVSGGVDYVGTALIYCKYCEKDTTQSLRKGVELGWDTRGNQHTCDLYDCPVCKNTNYYDHFNHKLI